jgi:polyhydroxyalkanoate synthesis regulator phasin
MAKKRTVKASGGLDKARQAFGRLEQHGVKLIARARKDVTQYLTSNQRRVVRDLSAQAKKVRTDIQKRVQRSGHDLEARAERLLKQADKRSQDVAHRTLKSLNLATAADVTRLEGRVATLEGQLAAMDARLRAIGRGAGAAAAAADIQSLSA